LRISGFVANFFLPQKHKKHEGVHEEYINYMILPDSEG